LNAFLKTDDEAYPASRVIVDIGVLVARSRVHASSIR
jgi:hypothetical protein